MDYNTKEKEIHGSIVIYFLKWVWERGKESLLYREEWQLVIVGGMGYSHILKEIPFRLLTNYNNNKKPQNLTVDSTLVECSNIRLPTVGQMNIMCFLVSCTEKDMISLP